MIRGNKIGLRALEREDLAMLRDWRNLPALRKNFREFRELNMVNQENWFAKVSASSNDFMFMIERLDDKKPIGACGLLYTNWIIRSADFSIYIGHEEAYIDEHGYAKESAELLIDYGFGTLNLNKVWMEIYEFDTVKLDFFVNELGFQREGRLRENCFEAGKYWDSFIISLLRKDYK